MMTVLGVGAIALSVLVFLVVYLLLIASSRAEETEARVQALLREARAGRPGAEPLPGGPPLERPVGGPSA
ncbi:MAG: hypothetical protein EOM92_16105 [Gammaproteobacteria bacterium]|nr:hypothetical protein [Gammaproteobacteria bacterium]